MSFPQLGDVSLVERSLNIIMFYSICEVLCNQIPSKEQKLHNSSRKFQDASTTHLPWAESIVDENGLMQELRCKIYTSIERKEKLLAPKLDSLLKHVGH